MRINALDNWAHFIALTSLAATLSMPAKASPDVKSGTTTTPSRGSLFKAQEKKYTVDLHKDPSTEQINLAIDETKIDEAIAKEAKQISPTKVEPLATAIKILKNSIFYYSWKAQEYKDTQLKEAELENARKAVERLSFMAKVQKLEILEPINQRLADTMIRKIQSAAAAKLSFEQGGSARIADVIREKLDAEAAIEQFSHCYEVEYCSSKDHNLLEFLDARKHLSPEQIEAVKRLMDLRRMYYTVANRFPEHKDLEEIKSEWQKKRQELFGSMKKATKDMLDALKELKGLRGNNRLSTKEKERKLFLEKTLQIPKNTSIEVFIDSYEEKQKTLENHMVNTLLDNKL